MQVIGSAAVGKSTGIADPSLAVTETHAEVHPQAPVSQEDEITITDLARLNLLMPPQDGARLEQLQQAVFSGRYGPPAATIAEALIAVAVSRGLKI